MRYTNKFIREKLKEEALKRCTDAFPDYAPSNEELNAEYELIKKLWEDEKISYPWENE